MTYALDGVTHFNEEQMLLHPQPFADQLRGVLTEIVVA